VDIISRKEWGARAPRSRSTVSWGTRTEFVVHYSEGPTTQTVRSIQDFHMGPSRGWADVGYNFLVDVHGRIYEGRGWLTVGAHAPDHNSSGIGVCMIGRDGDATPAALRSIRWLYDEAVRRKGHGLKKLGHRDVYSTSCPGEQLYKWVRAGMPAPKTGEQAPAADDQEDEDMPRYYGQLRDGAGAITPICVHPGDVTAIGFYADNSLAGLPPVKLRVAVHDQKKGWALIKEVTVDAREAKPWFSVPKTTDAFSVRREDDGTVPVAWDAS
jgi:hypothetical protein